MILRLPTRPRLRARVPAASIRPFAFPAFPAIASATIAFAAIATAALLTPPLPLPLVTEAAAASDVATPGAPAPDFTLKDLDGKTHTLSEYTKQGKVVVLEWFNPDCPFVQKHHKLTRNMLDTADRYRAKGIVWLAINSGAPGMQGAGLERNRSARDEYAMDYPILLDDSGDVGRAYGAKTTPHMYVIDAKGTLVYKGAIDDDRSARALGKTNYVARALDELLAGKPVTQAETASYGCSVKYKAS
ncbi:MAG: thioredoxin family protein [Candidatus Eisenbacteria bacterium]